MAWRALTFVSVVIPCIILRRLIHRQLAVERFRLLVGQGASISSARGWPHCHALESQQQRLICDFLLLTKPTRVLIEWQELSIKFHNVSSFGILWWAGDTKNSVRTCNDWLFWSNCKLKWSCAESHHFSWPRHILWVIFIDRIVCTGYSFVLNSDFTHAITIGILIPIW